MFLVGRAWFYIHGDAALLDTSSSSVTAELATETVRAVVDAVKSEL